MTARCPQELPGVRRFLARHGLELTRDLLKLRRADVLGQSAFSGRRSWGQLNAFGRLVEEAAGGALLVAAPAGAPGGGLDCLGSSYRSGCGLRAAETRAGSRHRRKIPNRREALLDWLRETGEL